MQLNFDFPAATATPRAEPPVLTVSELNRATRALIEGRFPLLWIAGEVSGFTRHSSGHCYFWLKDRDAQVSCVMFRQRAQQIDWLPENGMQVEALALVTLYEPRGQFQLNVETVRRAGLGALFEAFEKLKARLAAEGLFAPARKRPLPQFPRRVGVVTSREAAALRDFLITLRRRMPGLPVVLYPAPVQGEGAGARIADAIRIAGERRECDVLVVCRGGGSIEDLWAFNEEGVARAIAACPIPVVSGIGHETDFTIADFVADLRAATPTAAAELVSPNRAELLAGTEALRRRMGRSMRRGLETRMQQLDYLARRLLPPGERIHKQRVHLEHLARRLTGAWSRGADARRHRLHLAANRLGSAVPDLERRMRECDVLRHRLGAAISRVLERRGDHLQRLAAQLTHLNPQAVLARGYSIARRPDGVIVRSSRDIDPGDRLSLTFAEGAAGVRVEDKT